MTTTAAAPPPLTARVDGDLAELLREEDLLRTLVDAFGSPLNVVLPQQLTRRTAAFTAVLAAQPHTHRLFLAHKPNRSAALVRQAAADGVDLDVASVGELAQGLVNGFPGSRIEATGPKNAAFLRLAIQHGVLVQVDSADELRQIVDLAQALRCRRPVDIALRVAVAPSADSKFGLAPELAEQVIDDIAGRQQPLRLQGLAFHLTAGGLRERLAAFDVLLRLYTHALRRGLAPAAFNIGGGFAVQPLADPQAWQAYTSAMKRGLLGDGPALTWNDETFGLHVQEGRVVGSALLPDLARDASGPQELETFLRADVAHRGRSGGRSVAAVLADHGLQLHCEPGRAAYDQCGLTLARVTFVKRSARGAWLVGLDANRTALNVPDREVFLDPVVLASRPRDAEPVGAYLVGNLCHPGDLLARHLVRLDAMPSPGDVLAFPNTAAYVMDFAESATLLQRTAAKVAVADRAGRWRFWRDEDYEPALPGSAAEAGGRPA